MSAAFVSGVAALIKLKYPDLTPSQIRRRIISGAYPVDELDGYCSSGGVLDAYTALFGYIIVD